MNHKPGRVYIQNGNHNGPDRPPPVDYDEQRQSLRNKDRDNSSSNKPPAIEDEDSSSTNNNGSSTDDFADLISAFGLSPKRNRPSVAAGKQMSENSLNKQTSRKHVSEIWHDRGFQHFVEETFACSRSTLLLLLLRAP